ncbi:uncharacterized protein MONBRDRAFT_15013, partial [Monosiga brevicollis MX1]
MPNSIYVPVLGGHDETTVSSNSDDGTVVPVANNGTVTVPRLDDIETTFERIRVLGRGAYGTATLFRRRQDDELVVVKEIILTDLKPKDRLLAQNEVKLLAMFDHPNVIGYYDSSDTNGVLRIEMEYADGGNLAQWIGQQKDLVPQPRVLHMFKQIVAALDYVHSQNVIHRDIKADNVFLTRHGVPKLGDFGISKSIASTMAKAHTVVGTPYYISPELAQGKPYDNKTDIWSLGCVAYELLTLHRTFEGSNLPALVRKIMKGQFTPINGPYDPELKALVTSMLRHDPARRPSCRDMLEHPLLQK